MGILVDSIEKPKEPNILTEHNFEYVKSSCTCDINDCYERCVELTSLYDAWVAVKLTGEVFIYVEYECGGAVEDIVDFIQTKWEDSPEEFFEELDNIVTDVYNRYNHYGVNYDDDDDED